eukprot:gnl/TRDRNA2_/TRDRNA2_160969_c1_seq1.p1 gnl/TRDRNA2_/TRDRNA2_160969_c1~~gnl/TRDRNA2_/TRDRNA2_160969_c1_seq1.p1  ORF type:complete len:593 (+),score=95.28 gnl/TRDRNA2_/TRDRNA2_160969_c1_seq1:42-1781(+)
MDPAGEQRPGPVAWRSSPRPLLQSAAAETAEEEDLVLVSARPGVPSPPPPPDRRQQASSGRATLSGRKSILARGRVVADAEQATVQTCASSGMQVRSVRLLQQMRDRRDTLRVGLTPTPRVPSKPSTSPRPDRYPRRPVTSVGFHHYDKEKAPMGVAAFCEGRDSPDAGFDDEPGGKPRWDNSFTAVFERRIPTYDALADVHCHSMASPSRLRQACKTREFSSEYLHIVRSRFEDFKCKRQSELGGQHQPQNPNGGRKPRSSTVMPPSTFMQRVLEFQGSIDQAAAADVEVARTAAVPSLACSTDWFESVLHRDCAMRGKVFPEDAQKAIAVELEGRLGEDLTSRWTRLRSRIEAYWFELETPARVRQAVKAGPLATVTPESAYQLERHLKELITFGCETRQLICAWLDREEVLKAVCQAHAVCVNDDRLAELKSDLVKLDKLGTAMLNSIDRWARKFGHLAVDVTKVPHLPADRPPPTIFVWGGRDCVERIQSESDALSRGEPQLLAAAGDMLQANAFGSAVKFPSPLVCSAMAAQKFAVNDVLNDGPPPQWYRSEVAEAGIQAVKRGRPCGGGDRRE